MKHFFRMLQLSLAILLLGGGFVAAQDLKDHPGFVDLEVLASRIDQEPDIEISLKGSLLRLVAEASRIEDDELADMLLGIKAIRVEGYHLDYEDVELMSQLSSIAREISQELRSSGWDRVAKVREDDSQVYFYVKDNGSTIDGLTVMVIDKNEDAVFVNIVGQIDPAQVGRIGSKFNIDVLKDDRSG